MRSLVDALGRPVTIATRPQRIVSLVPSLTELLFALDAGPRVIGASDYCTRPVAELASVARVGGQKDPDLAALLALTPDLVIVVKEENLGRDVERLTAAGVPVYAFDVRTIEAALALPAELGELVAAPPSIIATVAAALQSGVSAAADHASTRPRRRVFCPVWRDPWIGVSHDTYLAAVLSLCGADPIVPPASTARYPKLTLEEARALAPDRVLLPSEPYAFGATDADDVAAALALPMANVRLADGEVLCWYGLPMMKLAEVARLLD